MINTATVTGLTAAAAVGGVKLIFAGVFLAIGFQIGNTIAIGVVKRLEARRYQKLEQLTEEPSSPNTKQML